MMSASDHLSPEQFRANYRPTEYSKDWDGVVRHVRHANCCGINERDEHGRGLNDSMRSSIKHEGIREPVQVKDGWVVDGHHRAAIALSVGANIPVEHTDHEMYEGQIPTTRRPRRPREDRR